MSLEFIYSASSITRSLHLERNDRSMWCKSNRECYETLLLLFFYVEEIFHETAHFVELGSVGFLPTKNLHGGLHPVLIRGRGTGIFSAAITQGGSSRGGHLNIFSNC